MKQIANFLAGSNYLPDTVSKFDSLDHNSGRYIEKLLIKTMSTGLLKPK